MSNLSPNSPLTKLVQLLLRKLTRALPTHGQRIEVEPLGRKGTRARITILGMNDHQRADMAVLRTHANPNYQLHPRHREFTYSGLTRAQTQSQSINMLREALGYLLDADLKVISTSASTIEVRVQPQHTSKDEQPNLAAILEQYFSPSWRQRFTTTLTREHDQA